MLRRAHKSFHSIENILLTHIHGDHIFGLFGLLSTFGMQGRTAPVFIYAPENVRTVIDFYRSQFGTEDRYEIVFKPLTSSEPEVIFESKSAKVTAIPLSHKIPTYGFIVHEKPTRKQTEAGETGKTYAYITDTASFPKLAEWLRGVDVLYHEATYPDEKQANAIKYAHSTASDAARDALDAGVKKLYLGHFSSAYPDLSVFENEARAIFPETYLASEDMIIEL